MTLQAAGSVVITGGRDFEREREIRSCEACCDLAVAAKLWDDSVGLVGLTHTECALVHPAKAS